MLMYFCGQLSQMKLKGPVYCFSLGVSAHEIIHFCICITAVHAGLLIFYFIFFQKCSVIPSILNPDISA